VQVRAPLVLISAAAWIALVIEPGGAAFPSHCSPKMLARTLPSMSLELPETLEPIASLAFGWALMLAAMMGPLVAAPVRHVRDRSFARRRTRAVALFGFGYVAIWMAAGVMLLALATAVRLIAPESSVMPLGTLIAAIWQCSPLKQRCLNRCHARSEVAAFGPAADVDALRFGLTHGVWCAGSCWALMLLPLLVSRGHVAAMAAVALWLLAERLDRPMPPRWRVRGVGKAARLVIARGADFSVRGATWPKSRLP
jgi:predicted metal-binding membrane protein